MIDSKTGLASIPEGYRWRIRANVFMGREWVTVLLQRRVGPFWHTVKSGETPGNPDRVRSETFDISDLWFNRDRTRQRSKEKRAVSKSLHGTYPPKTLR